MDFDNVMKSFRERKLRREGDCLYFIQERSTGMIKIGRSKDPKRRLKTLQTGNANELRLVCYLEGLGWRERELHELLKDWRTSGEWFKYECIGSIPDELYELIPWGSLDEWWRND